MRKNDLDALIESVSYQNGISPERIATIKQRLNKKPAIAEAFERARVREAAKQLFQEPPNDDKRHT